MQENQEKLTQNIQEEKIKKQEVDEKIKKAVQEELRIEQNQIAQKQSNQSHQKYTKLFEEKKGKMPFPLDQGFISMPFGRQAHKVLKYILEENAGIDITANPGAISFAVCEGVVTAIIYVPGTGYSVIVAHGNYRTIYSNLEEVYVVKDQVVKSIQKIGQVFTHPTSKRTVFHFEVWKTEEEKIVQLNPEVWIKKN